MNSNINYVEFVGIPGSGKSTISERLFKLIQNNYDSKIEKFENYYYTSLLKTLGIPNLWLTRKLTYPYLEYISVVSGLYAKSILEFQFEYSGAHRLMSQYLDYSKNQKRRDRVTRALLQYESMYKVIQKQVGNRKLIWDGGFTQRSISLFCPPHPLKEIKPDEIKKLIHSIPKPDVLVVVNCPIQIIIDRISNRINQRKHKDLDSYYHLPEHELISIFERMQYCINNIINVYENTQTSIIEISNEAPIDSTVCNLFNNNNIIQDYFSLRL